MFPERQLGPHRDWRAEIEFLDQIFPNGAAYTVGKVNGDHWLLYMTSPGEDILNSATAHNSPRGRADPLPDNPSIPATIRAPTPTDPTVQDYTIEILMTDLSPAGRDAFTHKSSAAVSLEDSPSEHALSLSSFLGITELFPSHLTTLDAYSFSPCGYSSNALIKWRDDAGTGPVQSGEGYYTIHVTPEEGWSYASFECNVPLPTHPTEKPNMVPDLKTLIRRVVSIFQPGRLTLTLFISSEDNMEEESAIEIAQRVFKAALTSPCGVEGDNGYSGVYRRTDKINYEFGGYDLAFASFERRS